MRKIEINSIGSIVEITEHGGIIKALTKQRPITIITKSTRMMIDAYTILQKCPNILIRAQKSSNSNLAAKDNPIPFIPLKWYKYSGLLLNTLIPRLFKKLFPAWSWSPKKKLAQNLEGNYEEKYKCHPCNEISCCL